MGRAVIAGVGYTKIGEHWDKSIGDLIYDAGSQLLKLSKRHEIEALFIGNMLSSFAGIQSNIGAYAADILGLNDVDVFHVNNSEASGASAIYQAALAVNSGRYEVVIAGGVEKMTDLLFRKVIEGLSLAIHAELFRNSGASLAAIAGILMSEYISRYDVSKEAITYLAVQDHKNASTADHAQFRRPITLEQAMRAPMIADPLTIFDVSPISDGCALLLITTETYAEERNFNYVKILGMGISNNILSIIDRDDILDLKATTSATIKALREAKLKISDISFYEINDDYTITGVLSLEALNLVEKGKGADYIYRGFTSLTGNHPINTFGGLKARGHPVGATGAYQAVEAYLQLIKNAGENQVLNAKYGLIQNSGGLDSISVVLIFGRC